MTLPAHRPGGRVTTIPLRVETLPGGRLRLSSPIARGWAAVASNPHELARAVEMAFTETAVAAYAKWKNRPYDLDQLTTPVSGDPLAAGPQARTRRPKSGSAEDQELVGRRVRRVAYGVEDWTRLEDGRWRSPSGRAYRADSRLVQNVMRGRAEKGLPND